MPRTPQVARRILRSLRPDRIETIRSGIGDGLRISLQDASADYVLGGNEVPVQQAIAESVTPGGVFYDVGANIGFFSLVAARRAGPTGHVYAFEPVPRIAARIRRNARLNGFDTIEVLEVAAVDRAGRAPLMLSAHPGGATLSDRDTPSDLTGRIEVETVAIDDLVEAGRLRPPTSVKIDVEGVELAVLQGLERTLRAHRPTVVCELDDETPAGIAAKLTPIVAYLGALGYQIIELPRSYEGTGWQVLHLVATPGPVAAAG